MNYNVHAMIKNACVWMLVLVFSQNALAEGGGASGGSGDDPKLQCVDANLLANADRAKRIRALSRECGLSRTQINCIINQITDATTEDVTNCLSQD